jgi:molybdopterin-guanine dinucleotide biosynthesis protein A
VSSTSAIVLSGGSSARLAGVDKTRLALGGITLLDRVLGVLTGPVVVVGPERPTAREVLWTREEPVGGGPLAALAAGLAYARGERVLLLAADLPFLTAGALAALEEAAAGGQGAVAVDEDGREQPLLSCWDTAALRAALPAQVAGGRLRAATEGLDAVRVALPGSPPPWWDCDTPEAWARAQEWAGRT